MRTIKLTHDEIESIKKALQYVVDSNLNIISQNIMLIGHDVADKIREQAIIYNNIIDVFNGDRDV